MVIHKIVNSVFNSCTYIVYAENSRQALLIDCGDVQPIVDYLSEKKLELVYVLPTHTHYDHIYGLNEVIKIYPSVKIGVCEYGKEGLVNPKLNNSRYHTECEDFIFNGTGSQVLVCNDNDILSVGKLEVKVLATPGHDPSCLSFLIGQDVFTGDSYIPGIKVMDKWPKSNKVQAAENEERLKQYERDGYSIHAGHILVAKFPPGSAADHI